MFTGLIEKTGKIRRVSRGKGLVLEVESTPWEPPLEDGESVAVDGVCLTVARHDRTRFTADVLEETASRSTLGGKIPGARVNLERALRAGDRFGGHVVQGHVDGTGTLVSKTPRGRDFRLTFRCPRPIAAATVLKGSIAVNGVSLTVSDVSADSFSVDVIPTTLRETDLADLAVGDAVNLESDILGRYALRAAETAEGPVADETDESGLTMEKLAENGFL